MRALTLLVALGIVQQANLSLEQILDRLGTYLTAYEVELSTLVADEFYEQRLIGKAPGRSTETLPDGRTPIPAEPKEVATRRRLHSTISFLRLPGGAAWLGMREVRAIDEKPVPNSGSMMALLTGKSDDVAAQAVAIAKASAEHNLGGLRTINMPTLPLELLHPRYRDRMSFRLSGRETIRGTRTRRVEFEEKGPPTLIVHADGGWVRSRGIAWIEEPSGAVWRAHVFYSGHYLAYQGRAPESEVKVEFVRSAALGMLVPEQMREVFAAPPGRGEGTATYSNFRRFTTSARIIP